MRLHDVRLVGTAAAAMLAATVAGAPAAEARQGQVQGQAQQQAQAQECTPPPLPGQVVDVTLTDSGNTMRLTVKPAKVKAGQVSLLARNTGTFAHEAVVLPLAQGQTVGRRPIGSDSRASETGSVGEASKNCGKGEGEGIAPGSAGWTTLTLRPGKYEVICNFPGHYAAGMRAELDVTG
uniref:plastocyanin/azurin family copper-binding protein n=1 Tax=Nonomuraea pusilla TaxID=46177 RepID=UPI0009E98C6E|nr:plastocyanin/azurin family copper-binding protein [Nonomuraea pusilla]